MEPTNLMILSPVLEARRRRLGLPSIQAIPEIRQAAADLDATLADQERDELNRARAARHGDETVEDAMERLASEAEAQRAAEAEAAAAAANPDAPADAA